RLKIPAWIRKFKALGGNFYLEKISEQRLITIGKEHDLLVIASGKGAISHLFHKNVEACFSEKPMRSLSLIYTQGVEPVPEKKGVRINIVPNVAEFFTMPGLTLNGPCEMMLLEAIPNGEADFINTVNTPEDQLEATLEFLKRYLPWEAERCE